MDEKFLDGPNVGYCSSSDDDNDEGDEKLGGLKLAAGSNTSASASPSSSVPANTGPNTGPKGVLADYQLHQEQLAVERRLSHLKMLEKANRFSVDLNNSQVAAKGEDEQHKQEEDELEVLRRRRLEQLKNLSRGSIMEIADSNAFLSTIESHRGYLVFVHIYRDGLDSSAPLNEALLELAATKFSGAKFYKVKADLLGTTDHFKSNALPVLQVYKDEQLLGNFIRITEALGEDFDAAMLHKFLEAHNIQGYER